MFTGKINIVSVSATKSNIYLMTLRKTIFYLNPGIYVHKTKHGKGKSHYVNVN